MPFKEPIIYSGYNYNNFNPVLTYIYDSGISGYRSLTPADLETTVGSINVSGIGAIIVNTDDIEASLTGVRQQLSGTNVKGSFTDRSSTISGSNTSQTLAFANSNRNVFYFQNISSQDNWINIDVPATTGTNSFWVSANGGFLSFEPPFVPTGVVNVIAVTSGGKFVAKEA